MSNYFRFYLPLNSPTGLSGVVGGAISTNRLENALGALFADMPVSASEDLHQYRKIFAQQDRDGTFTNVSIELANVEHDDQVFFDVYPIDPVDAVLQDDTAVDAITPPTGLSGAGYFTGDYETAIAIPGNTTIGDSVAIWLKQVVPQSTADDPLASFTLRITANRIQ